YPLLCKMETGRGSRAPCPQIETAATQERFMPRWLSGFALFAYGFRPFFLLAGVYAVLALAVWLAALGGTHGLLPPGIPPHYWHGHEMLFGFVAAAIAGFLLTAVPSWTGGRGYSGGPLVLMTVAWLAGRIAMLFAGTPH